MQEKTNEHTNTCSFADVRPIMMDMPYPPIRVREKNPAYANLLSLDYCGSTSELSAITQYINNENRISYERCSMAKTLLGIAMAEMMHLQKLGELIYLLGGTVDYTAKLQNGKQMMWTPEFLDIPDNVRHMIAADIKSERAAINQYRMHIRMIRDRYVTAVLERIILDEQYHIMMLRQLMNEIANGNG